MMELIHDSASNGLIRKVRCRPNHVPAGVARLQAANEDQIQGGA
jgi:hypothetical protein